MTDLAAVLAATPICRDLSEPEVQRIAAEGRIEHWASGSTMLEEGTTGPRLVILLEGRVDVLKRDKGGHEHPIASLGPGSVMGEVSLLLQSARSATVRASEPLTVFAMERPVFQEMIDEGDLGALDRRPPEAGRVLEGTERAAVALGFLRLRFRRCCC
jgi:CRP-like cAMP-binding protein